MKQIIAAHTDDFLKIQACSDDKTLHLRAVYDKIHIIVQGLEFIGIPVWELPFTRNHVKAVDRSTTLNGKFKSY